MEQTNGSENTSVPFSFFSFITKEYVLSVDLRKLRGILYNEDSEGHRCRERVIAVIDEIGVENWFKARGLPTSPDSVWKNRYTSGECKLKDINTGFNYGNGDGIVDFYLWENWLPKEIWTDDEADKNTLARFI